VATRQADESAATLTLDWLRCAGHGVCAAAFAELLHLDEWGFPGGVTTRGAQVAGEHLQAARLAVRTCPAAALRLHEGPSGR
jgi:ferredoxin